MKSKLAWLVLCLGLSFAATSTWAEEDKDKTTAQPAPTEPAPDGEKK